MLAETNSVNCLRIRYHNLRYETNRKRRDLPHATVEQLYEIELIIPREYLEKKDLDCCGICLMKREESELIVELSCFHCRESALQRVKTKQGV